MNLQLTSPLDIGTAGGLFTPRDLALCCLPVAMLFASILSLM